MSADSAVSMPPKSLWEFCFGPSKDPKVLTETFKSLKIEVGHIETVSQDILSMFFLQDDDDTKRLYLKQAECAEFVKFCDERYFPSYDKIVKLKEKVVALLRTPVNYESKTKTSEKYQKLCKRIASQEKGHAKILFHYNKELKFVPYNSYLKSLGYIFFVNPIKASLNIINSKTGSKINTFAILVFGAYSIYNYYTNGLGTTAFHSTAFTGAYLLLGKASQIIRSNI